LPTISMQAGTAKREINKVNAQKEVGIAELQQLD
jgi:hypothetical protein